MKRSIVFGITALLMVIGGHAFAQQSSTVEGFFMPIVGQSSISNGNPAVVSLMGIKRTEGTVAPYQYEWRKDTDTGQVVGTGVITDPEVDNGRASDQNAMSVSKPGTYVLVVTDSSVPARQVVKSYEVEAQN